MDGLEWKTLLKWMIWGYHYFRKHPYTPPENSHDWLDNPRFESMYRNLLKMEIFFLKLAARNCQGKGEGC